MTDVVVPAAASPTATRRYGPVALFAIAAALALVGLPSALNLPQANPNQTLEYAPVPPDNNSVAPPGGIFAGLGLGSSSTIGAGSGSTGTGGLGELGPPPPPGQLRPPTSKRCVGNPPRQSEDPLSPPCVPFYQGDNGGATFHGVSRSQINIVVYFGCYEQGHTGTNNNAYQSSQGLESPKCNTTDDADAAPSNSDFLITRIFKRYAVYFNDRYQTYNRHVHLWIHYANDGPPPSNPSNSGAGCDVSCRQADASNDFRSAYSPFAVLPVALAGGASTNNFDTYLLSMVQKGVLGFVGDVQEHQSFFQQYPGYIWGFAPSIENQAHMYATFICQKVVGHTASFSGNSGDAAKNRVLGMLYMDDTTSAPYYTDMKKLIEAETKRDCGATYVDHAFEGFGASTASSPNQEPDQTLAIQDFQSKGVTTVIWEGWQNGELTQDSDNLGYYPEWLVMGDGSMEDFASGRYADQKVWSHAWALSNVTLDGHLTQELCAQAMREVDPNFPTADITTACNVYDVMRQLFTGIQVAGPHLTPSAMDQGFHAIPPKPSTNAQVPSCFYPAADYTCVKDAIAMWWDQNGQVPGWTGSGCFRATQEGKRYIAGQWPAGDVKSMYSAGDPCNGYGGNAAAGPWSSTDQ